MSLTFDVALEASPAHGVSHQIDALRELVYDFNGDIHAQNTVQLAHRQQRFTGCLVKMSIDYQMFAPDGTPLRAQVRMVFKSPPDTDHTRKGSDLTHFLGVNPEDHLPDF